MKYQLATIIVTNAVRTTLKAIAAKLDRDEMDGMFDVGLSATGALPATHWISSGHVPKPLVILLRNPALMFTVAKKAWVDDGKTFPYTQAQVTNALSKTTVTAGANDSEDPLPTDPLQTIADAGLQLIQGTIDV